jgi:hypothetical protein
MPEIPIHARNTEKHPCQNAFVISDKKRIVIKAGRRGGKTVGIAKQAVERFANHQRRQLYAAPTTEQTDAFWFECLRALQEPIDLGALKVDRSARTIENPRTKERIKAKTAWNADTLRGDYADDLYLDEYQLMNEDAWEVVGQPMLLDNNGDAVFIYTPPSLISAGVSKARDPLHASKLFKKAQADESGLWATFHFTSWDNPFISKEGLKIVAADMSQTAYRQEIMAEDDEISPKQLIYSAFNERICKVPRVAIPPRWLVYSGHDFGSANPAALFFAKDPDTGYFYLFNEYLPGGGRSTYQHALEFKRITDGMRVDTRAGGSHQEDEIRQGYSVHGWPIKEPKIGNVGAGIDKVRGMFDLDKIRIFDDMALTLSELSVYKWKVDPNGIITNEIEDKAKFHLMDCMRYILSDFTPETATASKGPE